MRLCYFICALLINLNPVFGSDPESYLDGRLDKTNGRYETFKQVINLLEEKNVKTLIETGTARCGDSNFDGDGGSTIIFAHWAVEHDAQMYSVDIDAVHIEIAKQVTEQYMTHLTYALEDSVTFLKEFEGKIDFLYLDSWDYSESDPYPAQIHNLKEVLAAYDKLHDQSIIMIDDCNIPGGGKGKLAIDFLLQNGWYKFMNRHQVILLRN